MSSTDSRSPSNFDNSGTSEILKKLRNPDRVILAIVIILGAVALGLPDQLSETIGFILDNLWSIAPFILISVLLAGYIKASGADRLIGAAFRANARKAIFVAALVGALSPFCSCGVVPLIAALLASGVPLAPVMAFWLSSPVIDPEMAILTAGALGTEFASAKLLAAVLMGLLGGWVVLAIQRAGGFANPLRHEVTAGCGTGAVTDDSQPEWRPWRDSARRASFRQEVVRNGFFLGKWLTVAFILEALMLNNAPMDQIGNWLASAGAWAIPAAAVVGVPAYLNGYAAIPMADALMQMGLSPAGALSFMVAGGVTSIPAAVAVKALVKTQVFLSYLAIALAGSVMVGFLYAGWALL